MSLIIEVKTILHNEQRYDTVADWVGNEKNRFVTISDTGNSDYDFLLAIHELIEQALCYKRGITTEMVDKFDIEFHKNDPTDEPGDDLHAPYHKEHVYATAVELSLAKELNVNVDEYYKRLDDIYLRKV